MENEQIKKKHDPQIIRNLWSEDDKVVLKTIHRLRSEGNIHYIPELLKLLNNSGREVIERELVRFMADIKNPAIRKILIKGLKDPELSASRGNVVSICWQSGMDYTRELDIFVSLFLDGDYMTALECFTIIEESVIDMKREDIARLRGQVCEGLKTVSEEKRPLADEMIRLLEI